MNGQVDPEYFRLYAQFTILLLFCSTVVMPWRAERPA